MELLSTMSLAKTLVTSGTRFAAGSVLAVAIAGCSMNPFSDDEDAGPVPVERRAEPVARMVDTDSSEATAVQSGQRLQLIEQRSPIASGAPEQYTVQEGDTLWDIASTFLQDPWYWPEVWYINPQVENPHLIYPGDVLSLVTIDGQERVMVSSGSTYRLSPAARITPLDESVRSIPYESVAAFLSSGAILEKNEGDKLPYILASRGDHIVAAAGMDVYVRGGEPAATGSRYTVIHIDDELVDPDDGETVGFQADYVGEGVISRGGDPATMALTDSSREALLGDRLVPVEDDVQMNFFPKPPDYEIDGRIISVVDGVSLIGQYQVVIINRGARDGLQPGDVLDVFQTGETIRDRFAGGFMNVSAGGEKVKLPDEQAGTVMVFKVHDRIGYGLVMEATNAIHVLDTVKNPT